MITLDTFMGYHTNHEMYSSNAVQENWDLDKEGNLEGTS